MLSSKCALSLGPLLQEASTVTVSAHPSISGSSYSLCSCGLSVRRWSSGRWDTIPPTSGIFVAGAYFVEERGIWDRVKWIDGIIYIHTSLGPEHLGEWAALMYYLQKF